MRDTTTCPECGDQAQVQWRTVLESTDGPVEHSKIRCVSGHNFLLPVAMLANRSPTATLTVAGTYSAPTVSAPTGLTPTHPWLRT